ncbi:MAG: ADP-glyceromanno-heptose 6-epimerase [Bacteroidetes bacterium]|nr:ADP-glyceromanno-heptose 6-epimerase [Bacteroidota bacterium]
MYILTGAAGFIGSCLLNKLNNKGIKDIVIADDFSRDDKSPNYVRKKFLEKVDRQMLIPWLDKHYGDISCILHIGARTDTTEFNMDVLNRLNLDYSKGIWNACVKYQIPLIYASSAATYGLGDKGFSDDHDLPFRLEPLNPYGISKNEFDKWVLSQPSSPPFWAGLKFFNVYGPNEYHKGRMASVIFHAYNQIKDTGKMKLFRSHRPDYPDGGQLRDFIYVKDVLNIIWFLLNHNIVSGLYNVGTGHAGTFLDLAHAVFHAINREPVIDFIDTPPDIRDKYQYFTEANTEKILASGYDLPFHTLEDGIREYVVDYLTESIYY